MRAYLLSVFLLVMVAFSLATTLDPWFQSWAGSRTQSDNVLQVALGDSRRMFARHFFTKADAYFHKGFYPTIYDRKEGDDDKAHIAESAHGEHDDEDCADGQGDDAAGTGGGTGAATAGASAAGAKGSASSGLALRGEKGRGGEAAVFPAHVSAKEACGVANSYAAEATSSAAAAAAAVTF